MSLMMRFANVEDDGHGNDDYGDSYSKDDDDGKDGQRYNV